jgi:plasmid rolling circle replication initiator protein Rep
MLAAPTAELGDRPMLPSVAAMERFSKRKRFHRPIAMALQKAPELQGLASAIANCAQTLHIQLELPEGAPPVALLKDCRPCNRRLCPFCGWRRSKVWRGRMRDGLPRFFAEHPSHKAVFLTLTVRNCRVEDLGETLKEMHRAWNRLLKVSAFPTEFWFRSTEVTLGRPSYTDDLPKAPRLCNSHQLRTDAEIPPGCACVPDENPDDMPETREGHTRWCHPHIHALLLVPASYFGKGYVKQSEWERQWQMALRADYRPRVDIRRARAKDGAEGQAEDTKDAALEAAKYVTKATDLLQMGNQLPEFAHQIRGHRLSAMSTKLRKYVPAHDPSGEEMSTDVNSSLPSVHPFIPCVAQWAETLSEYTLLPL